MGARSLDPEPCMSMEVGPNSCQEISMYDFSPVHGGISPMIDCNMFLLTNDDSRAKLSSERSVAFHS